MSGIARTVRTVLIPVFEVGASVEFELGVFASLPKENFEGDL